MSTIRPTNKPNNVMGSTIRPNSDSMGNEESTVRPDGINPTVRTGGSMSTIRPGTIQSLDNSSTVRLGSDKTVKQQTAKGATTSQNDKVDTNMYQPRTSYTINGTVYTVIRALSLTSGEAQVFLVEDPKREKLVLKLYYKGAMPSVSILNKVISVNDASIFFREDAHGAFEDRYYELMKYYDGGNLENVDVRKNETAISQYIGKMAAAIDLCHHLGFIHRDIKPSNFIFETQEHKNILLGDFGIAVECDSNGKCVSDMARTKIYAAPEVYLNTGDGKANFSIKSDFYSLGIVILFLWMGKDEFTHFEKENELQLATMKTYGDLPIPSTMPTRLYSLVKSLLEPKPNDRAGFKEIEAWLKGENPFGQHYTQSSAASNKVPFHVVFNGEKGLIASSPKELARIMMANQQLAISYLYKGRISMWLEDNGRPELAVEMERIKEDLFPQNTTAGLEAACYILNPSMPFVDICGNNCSTSAEIASSILANFDKYQTQISNDSNSRLLVYLQTHGLEQAVIDFRKEFAENKRLGLLYLAYRLNADQPWYMTNNAGETASLNTCDEILNWVSTHDASEQSLSDVVGKAFLLWTSKRNAVTAAAIQPIVRHQGDINYSLGVLYRLNPKVGLFLVLDEKAPNYIFTIPQLASLINRSIMNVVNDKDPNRDYACFLCYLLDIYEDEKTTVYHFLQSKGEAYAKYIDWIKYCMDVKSADNTKKAGPYNETIGLFKMVKWMAGGSVFYTFKSGKTIYDPSELSGVSQSDLTEAMNNKYRALEAWISVFFQEDPKLDKTPKFTYEQKVSEYLNFLSANGFDTPEIHRYRDSKQVVESRAEKLRNTLSAIKNSKLIVSLISLMPLGIAALLLTFLWRPEFGAIKFDSVFKPVAIILTIFLCFAGGFSGRIIGEIIWGCIIGAVISGVIVWLSGYAATVIPYIAAAIVAALGWYLYKKCLGANLKEDQNKDLLNPGFEHLELEPLYEAYHPNSDGFDSSIGDRTANYLKELSQIKKTMWKKAVPIGILTIIGIFYFSISPSNPDSSNGSSTEQTMPDFSKGLYGNWVGKLERKNVQVQFEKTDNPQEFSFSMSIDGDKSENPVFSGNYDSSLKKLSIMKCRVSNRSGLAATVKSSGTLHLNNGSITGNIEIQIPQRGVESISMPIDIQYVSE